MNEPFDIIQTASLTEKASLLSEKQNKYVFRVSPRANKIQIKAAVEAAFPDVTVLAVNTLNVHRKARRQRTRLRGYRTGWKKAIVTLAPGQRIEIFEGI